MLATTRRVRLAALHRCFSTAPSPSRSYDYDVGIVGGGIVGVATARELLLRHPKLKVGIFEKESSLGQHQSSHNSGVIHSGLYYAPGSKRAQLCVKGSSMMYVSLTNEREWKKEYCKEKGIPHSQCGKLIVAVNSSEIPRLEALLERGIQNGVQGLRMLNPREINDFEPFCVGIQAIHVPTAGIVDFLDVVKSMAKDAKQMGCNVHLNYEAELEQAKDSEGITIKSKHRPTSSKSVRHVITCAGLYSDRVAKQLGGKDWPAIVPFRGDFLRIKPKHTNMVSSLVSFSELFTAFYLTNEIYPVPNPEFPFLGVHFTRRINGEAWLGPNAVLGFAREGYHWSKFVLKDIFEALMNVGLLKLITKHWMYGIRELYRDIFPKAYLRRMYYYMPFLTMEHIDLSVKPSGVRAQAIGQDGKLVEDFVFDIPEGGRVIHVRNAPSPACTSSLAIAQEIADTADKCFKL